MTISINIGKNIEVYLKEKILQTLENLAEILHFKELDMLITNFTNKVKTSLIAYDKAKEIQKKIIEFEKKIKQIWSRILYL